jgi:hypothetical protein
LRADEGAMTIRLRLLSSASVIAIAVGVFPASAAPAQSRPDWYFAVEGGALFTSPTVTSVSRTPNEILPGPEQGGRGALTLGGTFDGSRDWQVRLSHSVFDNLAVIYTDNNYALSSHYAFTTADFEAGFRRASEAGDFRFGAGLRALGVSESSVEDKVGRAPTYELSSGFAGIGPRATLSFDQRLAGSAWGWSGMVGGSAVFGQRSASAVNISTQTGKFAATILNAEASLGIDYHATPASTITFGVRGEKWWNLRAGSTDPYLAVVPDISDWGPFIRWTAFAP